MSDVTAIVIGESQDQRTLPRLGVAEIVTVPSLREMREAARSATTPLIWIVDSRATPFESTLPALRQAPEPAVSLPVDRLGNPVESLIGQFAQSDLLGVLDAISKRRTPLRHTFLLSLLVERSLATEIEPPDIARFGPYAGTDWTARLFAAHRGMLIPESRIRFDARPTASPLHILRMARTDAWTRPRAARELHGCAVNWWSARRPGARSQEPGSSS